MPWDLYNGRIPREPGNYKIWLHVLKNQCGGKDRWQVARCMFDSGAKISVIEYHIIKANDNTRIQKSNHGVRFTNEAKYILKQR